MFEVEVQTRKILAKAFSTQTEPKTAYLPASMQTETVTAATLQTQTDIIKSQSAVTQTLVEPSKTVAVFAIQTDKIEGTGVNT